MNNEQMAREISNLRYDVNEMTRMVDTLTKAVGTLTVLVRRHDNTLKIIHRGLHDTTDPAGPGV